MARTGEAACYTLLGRALGGRPLLIGYPRCCETENPDDTHPVVLSSAPFLPFMARVYNSAKSRRVGNSLSMLCGLCRSAYISVVLVGMTKAKRP